jgi:hypothetical protein
MEALATDFYAELLGRPRPRDHDLNLTALGLPQVDLSSLDANFSEAEVWAAIKEMPANKNCPGLNQSYRDTRQIGYHMLQG